MITGAFIDWTNLLSVDILSAPAAPLQKTFYFGCAYAYDSNKK